jgi:hypothetical protein
MIDASDPANLLLLRDLLEQSRRADKKLVVWVGAGASAWLGYPLWNELAERAHHQFSRREPRYDKRAAQAYLEAWQLSLVFEECHRADQGRYRDFLLTEFTPRPVTPVYARFVSALVRLQPVRLVTTNIDPHLEQALGPIQVVDRQDLERISGLLDTNQSFVAKIHGSLNNLRGIVFTQSDYADLSGNEAHLASLRDLFRRCCVLFIGTGMGDEYILDAIRAAEKSNELLGVGPHFALLAKKNGSLPAAVRQITYVPQPHKDHRTSIQVIEEVAGAGVSRPSLHNTSLGTPALKSAHLLSDPLPPGTWNSSSELAVKAVGGDHTFVVSVGHGITEAELPYNVSTAMHDLVVGLVSFDVVYAPLTAVGRLLALVSDAMLVELVDSGSLRLIHWDHVDGIAFRSKEALSGGELINFQVGGFTPGAVMDTTAHLRRFLKPEPGKEREFEEFIQKLVRATDEVPENEASAPHLITKGLLLRPSIREMLGMSGGTPLHSIPQWMKFPVLRLSSVVRVGHACQVLGIASTKLEFGSAVLAGPCFAGVAGVDLADNVASFVVAGRFNANLGNIFQDRPELLRGVLRFRETPEGTALRREVLSQLTSHAGADFAAAINAGLKQSLPPAILQSARDQLVNLLAPSAIAPATAPAVWNDASYSAKALSLWRKESKRKFEELVARLGINPYTPCPCGSGEKLRFCCGEALNA